MKYTSGFFVSLFKNTWTIETRKDVLFCKRSGETHEIDYFNINSLRIDEGLITDSVFLTYNGTSVELASLSHVTCTKLQEDLKTRINKNIGNRLLGKKVAPNAIVKGIDGLLRSDMYLAQSDIKAWLREVPDIGEELGHPLLETRLLSKNIQQAVLPILEMRNPKSRKLADRNKKFVQTAVRKYSSLFSKLEKYPLTNEQMTAAVVDEDRNLLISAAGSGKTSTILAKAIYLLKSGLAQPEEILVLAYNKDAQVDVDERLNNLIKSFPEYKRLIAAKTFHGFGLEVVSHVEDAKPSLSKLATSGRIRAASLFNEMVETLKIQRPQFASKWRQFQLYADKPLLDIHQFKSLKEYKAYLKSCGAKLKQSNTGNRLSILTIDGTEVKSIEEARIANWLFINGISYEYERRYEYETESKEYRQYYPDFFYPDVNLYHEHFALDQHGNTPAFMGDEYIEGVKWKRELHDQNSTLLIETHSSDFYDGNIFERLKSLLIKHGVFPKPKSDEEVEVLLQSLSNQDTTVELFIAVLRHFKANAESISEMSKKAEGFPDKFRVDLFLEVFEFIYDEYQRKLGSEVDFEDLINRASEYLEGNKFKHQYKYILVDEFQDISQDRKRIIHALLGQGENIKLFAVGDDWQSIYRFSGADINIMTHFPDHFGSTAHNYLTETFRNYQGIVDVASTFIQENPSQLKKDVKARNDIDACQVIVQEYQSDSSQCALIDRLLTKINKKAEREKQNVKVYLLARYNHLKPTRTSCYSKKFPALRIEFKSIHASKGLESDYVILMGVKSGVYGFPSTMTDDPLLQLVIPKPELFPDAEERRLLYVAITRAKRAIFILSDRRETSPFVKELIKHQRVQAPKRLQNIIMCPNPKCGDGELVQRNGKYGLFMGCSNYPECEHTQQVKCPKCHIGKLVVNNTKQGKLIVCDNATKCNYRQEH